MTAWLVERLTSYKIYLTYLIPGGDTRGYSDDEEEEEEEDGEYMDQETVEQFEDRVLNKRAAKVKRKHILSLPPN